MGYTWLINRLANESPVGNWILEAMLLLNGPSLVGDS